MRGTLVWSVLKSWPTTLTLMLGYFASNSDASFWNSGPSIDASSTVMVTLPLPTDVLADFEETRGAAGGGTRSARGQQGRARDRQARDSGERGAPT